MSSSQTLETHAKSCRLLSISGQQRTGVQNKRNLATRNAKTLQQVDLFFQEKNRLLMNIRAASNAVVSLNYCFFTSYSDFLIFFSDFLIFKFRQQNIFFDSENP
jgi:hypothetical protein